MAQRQSVSWAEAGSAQPCLLTPGMTNRAIVEERLRDAGAPPAPRVDSNSILALTTLVRLGKHSIVLPERLARSLASHGPLRVIPIREEEPGHEDPQIALLLPNRDRLPAPLIALLDVSRRLTDV